MADPDGPRLLTHAASARYGAVARVLYQVLFLNIVVALAKIALGTATGAVSVLSDGFHSLTDSASNVVGLIGVSVARRPPDHNHPYGHRKYETMASVGILLFLLLVLVQVVRSAIQHLRTPEPPEIGLLSIAAMGATLLVNLWVVWYETRQGERLHSELLAADARHTRSDVMTTTTVIAALIGIRLGYPILDPLAALLVAGFILHACWQIALEASRILSDEVVFDEGDVRAVVQSVEGVIGCEKIRTRGSEDHVFMDLHLWVDGRTPLSIAHDTSHVVKDRLMARFPELADVVIHLEPPPVDGGVPRRRY